MARAKKPVLSDGAQRAKKHFDNTTEFHDDLCQRNDDLYRSWRGIIDWDSDAADWTSKLHPPIAKHIVETTTAGLLGDKLAFKVTPAPRFWEPGEFEAATDGAKAHEILHKHQFKVENFEGKRRSFALQAGIFGYSILKTMWRTDYKLKKYLTLEPSQVPGSPFPVPRLTVKERNYACYDGPVTDVVDVRDCGWNEAAVSVEKATCFWHRVWMHPDELKAQEYHPEDRPFGYRNVDSLKNVKNAGGDEFSNRGEKFRSRVKDMVEVLEIWYLHDDGKIHVCTLGNRTVELKPDRVNPFWHGKFPFTVCSLEPDLFRIDSMSQMEKIAHLQEGLWDLLNQWLDNVHLNNNLITLIRADTDDPAAFPREPGAQWLVEDKDQVGTLDVNQLPPETLVAMSQLRQDMQNIAGGSPFTSTSEARGVGADTATEAALVTNLAQVSSNQMKYQLNLAYADVGQLRTELNQQFIRETILAEQIGVDNAGEIQAITPYLLQGEYLFDTEPMTESSIRAERRAEANAKLQMAGQVAPILALMSQNGAARPLNFEEFVKDWLKEYGEEDLEKFFISQPAPAPAPGGAGGAPPGSAPAPNGQPPMGITGQGSIDPSVSPSSTGSVSPLTMIQRAMASQGGANNIG